MQNLGPEGLGCRECKGYRVGAEGAGLRVEDPVLRRAGGRELQGYLACKKPRHPRTLQWEYA